MMNKNMARQQLKAHMRYWTIPCKNFWHVKMKVKSVNVDDQTGKLEASVNVYTFWGIPFARINMSGKANPEDIHNMGFTNVWIE